MAQLLALHCQPLLPSGSAELDVTHSVQVAALLGTGLLYMGSAQRHLVEVMLKEIGMSYICTYLLMVGQRFVSLVTFKDNLSF